MKKSFGDCSLGLGFRVTYVVLDIWFTSGPQDDPAGLVVAVLAGQMEGREAAAVPEIKVRTVLAQKFDCPTEALPGCLVECGVAVLER